LCPLMRMAAFISQVFEAIWPAVIPTGSTLRPVVIITTSTTITTR
jgi:hypothetical protein